MKRNCSKSPKKKFICNSRKKPSLDKRFCIICNKRTNWRYDRNVGHGRCIECGSISLYGGKSRKSILWKLKHWKKGDVNFL